MNSLDQYFNTLLRTSASNELRLNSRQVDCGATAGPATAVALDLPRWGGPAVGPGANSLSKETCSRSLGKKL